MELRIPISLCPAKEVRLHLSQNMFTQLITSFKPYEMFYHFSKVDNDFR